MVQRPGMDILSRWFVDVDEVSPGIGYACGVVDNVRSRRRYCIYLACSER